MLFFGYQSKAQTDTLNFTSPIRSILQDCNGNYWFGSQNEGVCLFDGETFEYFTIKEGLSDNQVFSIQEDKNGDIWIGTAKGVCRYDGNKITKQTRSVLEDSKGEWMKTEDDLWFGAGNNEGVYRYNGREMNYFPFPDPKVINSYNVYFVTGLTQGKNNILWVGTYAGIFGYTGSTFIVINDGTLGFEKEGEYLHIRSVLEDTKGRLWIGNNGIGVLLYDGNSTINFSDKMGLIHPLSLGKGDRSPAGTLEHVFTIEEDVQGNIWFGDRDTGVWKYDGQTMVNYTTKDGLSDDFVLSIYTNTAEELLFGLADGSVYKFNGVSFDKRF